LVYRLWSSDWVKNPEREVEKIKELLRRLLEERKTHPEEKRKIISLEPDSSQKINSISIPSKNENLPKEFPEWVVSYRYTPSEELENIKGKKLSEEDKLIEGIKTVLKYEAPIHIKILCQRLLTVFERIKVTAVFEGKVRKLLKEKFESERIITRDDFIFVQSEGDSQSVKIRTNGDLELNSWRKTGFICNEEIENAVRKSLETFNSFEKEGLVDFIGEIFCFHRLTPKVRKRIEEVLDNMNNNELIVEKNGKVQRVQFNQ